MSRLFSTAFCLSWFVATASVSLAQEAITPNQPIASKRVTDSRILFVAHHNSSSALWIVTQSAEVHVVDPLTLEPLAKPKQLFDATISGGGLMPDQSGMLLSSYGGRVLPVGTAKWKTADWEVGEGIRPVPDVEYQSIAVAPTGSALALGTRSGSVALLDMQTGAVRWNVSVAEIPINSVAWSRDGKRLAACSGNWQRPQEPGMVYLLDPGNGDVIQQLADHTEQVNQVAFSPDGKSLTSVSADSRALTYDLRDLEKPPKELKRSSGVGALLYLNDGLCILARFGGGVEVCDLQQSRRKVLFAGHQAPHIRAMSVAPDGRHLVTTDFNGMVYVWALSNAVASPSQYESTHWNADPTADVFKIGTFTKADQQGRPAGWEDLSAFESGQARFRPGGDGTVTLSSSDETGKASIATSLELPANAEFVTFMVRLRGPSIERGDTTNAGGGVIFSFVDSKGQERKMPRVDPAYEGYRDWIIGMHTARVLQDETKLRARITLMGATGDLEVDNILIVPSDAGKEPTAEQVQALRLAIDKDDPEAIARLIKDDPQMLEMRTGQCDNGTPLIRAAWNDGSPKVAAKLIELDADIEARDYSWGNTPLRWSGWWGTHEVAAVLISAGAEPGATSRMAQIAKTANRGAKRSKEDFDLVSKLVDEYEAKLAKE